MKNHKKIKAKKLQLKNLKPKNSRIFPKNSIFTTATNINNKFICLSWSREAALSWDMVFFGVSMSQTGLTLYLRQQIEFFTEGATLFCHGNTADIEIAYC